MTMRGRLTWQNDGEAERSILMIGYNAYTIGRNTTSHVCLSHNRASQRHAKIVLSPGELPIYKLFVISPIGTILNNTDNLTGTPNAPAIRNLQDGDVLTIGSTNIRFSLNEEEEDDEVQILETVDDEIQILDPVPSTNGAREMPDGPSNSRRNAATTSKRRNEATDLVPVKIMRKETCEKEVQTDSETVAPDNLFDCSICVEVMHHTASIYPCMHKFCYGCILEWKHKMGITATCPECRARIDGITRDQKMTSVIEIFLANNPGKVREHDDLAELEAKEVKFALSSNHHHN